MSNTGVTKGIETGAIYVTLKGRILLHLPKENYQGFDRIRDILNNSLQKESIKACLDARFDSEIVSQY